MGSHFRLFWPRDFSYSRKVHRDSLKSAARVVVKLGTGVLTDTRKLIDPAQLEQIVAQVAGLRRAGKEVVIVTSGAVGAGMGALGFDSRPTDLAEKQACAAVGQPLLMAAYEKLFGVRGVVCAQVLLTHDDLEHHERHLNARNTLVTLLRHGVVPIINENDAISSTEIKFGDNDKLSALVAALLPADLLVLLTTVDGVMENFGAKSAKTISVIEKIDATVQNLARGTTSETAVGGMKSKVEAAKIAVRSGIPMVIASGRNPNVLGQIVGGQEAGTLFVAKANRLKGRKRWIAFFHHPTGTLVVDNGAKVALREKGKSLLPPGVARCEGDFAADEVVRICDVDGLEFARGIARFDSAAVRERKLPKEELVHRDDLVIL